MARMMEADVRVRCVSKGRAPRDLEEVEKALFERCQRGESVDVASDIKPKFRAYAEAVCKRFEEERDVAKTLTMLERQRALMGQHEHAVYGALVRECDGLLFFRLGWADRVKAAVRILRESVFHAGAMRYVDDGRDRSLVDSDFRIFKIRFVWMKKLLRLPMDTEFVFDPFMREIVRAYMREMDL